jgi:hypothetical protein
MLPTGVCAMATFAGEIAARSAAVPTINDFMVADYRCA